MFNVDGFQHCVCNNSPVLMFVLVLMKMELALKQGEFDHHFYRIIHKIHDIGLLFARY